MLKAGQTMACTAHSCAAAVAKMNMPHTWPSCLAPSRSSCPCCYLQEASEASGECVYHFQHKLEAAGADLRRDVAAALADAQEEVVARVRGTLSEAEARHAARLEGATCSLSGRNYAWCGAAGTAMPQLLCSSWGAATSGLRGLRLLRLQSTVPNTALGVPAMCRKTWCWLTS